MSSISEKNSDEALMSGLAEHSEEALQSIYRQFFPMIGQLVRQNHGDDDEAKDIFQEAMIILYGKAKDDHFILECKLKTYIYAVCKRLWLKRLAHKQKKDTLLLEDEDRLPDPDVEGDMQMFEEKDRQFRMMSAAMKQLGEPCRGLLEDFYLRQLSMIEIAEKFGYTNTDNAKTQKYKCLNRLKKIFFTHYKSMEEK